MPAKSTDSKVPSELTMLIFGSARNVTYFPAYHGPYPTRTWRKPVVGPPDRPFAELQVVQRLEEEGWRAAWVYRPGQYLSSWEPRKFVKFPPTASALLERISKRAGKTSGCWDVFAWRNSKPLFIELKRAGSSDTIRDSQVRWKKAAIAEGVDPEAFRLLEWFGGDLEGRELKLDFWTLDKRDGWAICRNGELSYSGSDTASVFAHYADWGAATSADLLWLVFARNFDGMTYCVINQRTMRKTTSKRKPQ